MNCNPVSLAKLHVGETIPPPRMNSYTLIGSVTDGFKLTVQLFRNIHVKYHLHYAFHVAVLVSSVGCAYVQAMGLRVCNVG